MKRAALLATLMLGLIALMHLLRLVLRIEIVAGGTRVPIWVSAFGFLVPAALAIALWRESRSS